MSAAAASSQQLRTNVVAQSTVQTNISSINRSNSRGNEIIVENDSTTKHGNGNKISSVAANSSSTSSVPVSVSAEGAQSSMEQRNYAAQAQGATATVCADAMPTSRRIMSRSFESSSSSTESLGSGSGSRASLLVASSRHSSLRQRCFEAGSSVPQQLDFYTDISLYLQHHAAAPHLQHSLSQSQQQHQQSQPRYRHFRSTTHGLPDRARSVTSASSLQYRRDAAAAASVDAAAPLSVPATPAPPSADEMKRKARLPPAPPEYSTVSAPTTGTSPLFDFSSEYLRLHDAVPPPFSSTSDMRAASDAHPPQDYTGSQMRLLSSRMRSVSLSNLARLAQEKVSSRNVGSGSSGGDDGAHAVANGRRMTPADFHQVLSFLYVGRVEAAHNSLLLCQNQIEYLVDLANIEELPNHLKGHSYCLCQANGGRPHARTTIAANLPSTGGSRSAAAVHKAAAAVFEEVNSFVDRARSHNKAVLIYGSAMNIEQCVCVVLEYLIYYLQCDLGTAMEYVRQKCTRLNCSITRGTKELLERWQLLVVKKGGGPPVSAPGYPSGGRRPSPPPMKPVKRLAWN